MEPTADIGVTGLAVMGANLARNLARSGLTVAVHNRTQSRTDDLVGQHPEAGFVSTTDMAELKAALRPPRTVIVMVQAGRPTDAVIAELADVLDPGDVIVDGGNADFHDTIRRTGELAERDIEFVGMGISGGEEGALNGPSLMPGGSEQAWRNLEPALQAIAARVDDEPMVAHIGTDGAGHFVKMVHNGIEYADMQLIAEAYELLRTRTGLTPQQIADVFETWNRGELQSYLVEITVAVLRRTDADTGTPMVEVIRDEAAAKGTGAWTVQNALELGTGTPTIAAAVFARSLSSATDQRAAVRDVLGNGPTPDADTSDPQDAVVDDIAAALLTARLVAYAEGFALIAAGARAHDWQIDPASVAFIWRGGCIIRAALLDHVVDAFRADPGLPTLLVDPWFAQAVHENLDSLRRVVEQAVGDGSPVPAMSAALGEIDALRSARLPAALIQAQRDYFGAHTYRRTDRDGAFHLDWANGRESARD